MPLSGWETRDRNGVLDMKKTKKFKINPDGISTNYLLKGDGFYISYNPQPCKGSRVWGSDDGQPETALVKDGVFRILNGDFRKKYSKRIDSFDECLEFFNSKKDSCVSSWSDVK